MRQIRVEHSGFWRGSLRVLLKSWEMGGLMEHKWKDRLAIEEKDVSNVVPIKTTWIPWFPPTPAHVLSSSISPSIMSPPFISLSLYLSACLFLDKNPIRLFFKDWTAGRELDALVAKVMTTAIWSAQMHPAVAHTHSRTLAHSPVLPTLQTVHAFEWHAVWRHSKVMWATYYTLRATSNVILAQKSQIWHLKAVSSSEA